MKLRIFVVALSLSLCFAALWTYMRGPLGRGKFTIADRLRQVGSSAETRMLPFFRDAGVPFPPDRVALLAFKDEAVLEVQAAGTNGQFKHIRRYPIKAASGGPGPKLREGDRQVPEGLYPIESLNPNSLYHLALRVGYPNTTDRQHGREDKRSRLGGDIMIHGKAASIGCLAMGDPASEELFVLAARTGLDRVEAVFCPGDFREKTILPPTDAPAWTGELYAELARALKRFPVAERSARLGGDAPRRVE